VIIAGMKPSRLVLFLSRWAILSGLAGVMFAALVFMNREPSAALDRAPRRLLFASAILLSFAFMLAPFVRKAFVGRPRQSPTQPARKTLLDEMREREESQEDVAHFAAHESREQSSAPGSVVPRLLVALYVVFGAVLAAVLWSMG
jgi:hypothetical protein